MHPFLLILAAVWIVVAVTAVAIVKCGDVYDTAFDIDLS